MTRDEFLRRRKTGIGGSDVAAIMGFSKFRTPYDVWKDKTTEEVNEQQSDVLELASFLEEYTAQKYANLKGCKVQRKNSLLIHGEFDFLIGNIDREILLDHERGVGILECKALSTFNFRRVEQYGLPEDYICQIQHYFLTSNGRYKWAAFGILNRDNGKMLTFEVFPDLELMNTIKDVGVQFWNECVLKNIPPANQIEHKEVTIPKFDGTISDLTGDNDLKALLSERAENEKIYKEAKSLLEDTDCRIKDHLGEVEAADCGGFRLYYRGSSRTSIDSTRLKKEKPEIYKEYSKTSECARSLKIYEREIA